MSEVNSLKRKKVLLVVALYALLASTFTIGKMLLGYVSPIFLIAVRMTFSGATLLCLFYFINHSACIKRSKDWLMLFALSVIHILIPYATEFMALQKVAPSYAAMIYNLSPLFSAFFAYLVFGEKMTRFQWLGLAVGILGIAYFANINVFYMQAPIIDKSCVLLLISVSSASLGWVLVKHFVHQGGYSLFFVNGIAMLLGGLQSLAISSLVEPQAGLPWGSMYQFGGLLVLITLIANILFYNLYGYLLKQYSNTFLSFVGFLTPLFTAMYDWMFLGERIEMKFFSTIIIVGLGIYIFYKEELKSLYVN